MAENLPDDVRLILASQSPRRRALLQEAGYVFEVLAPDDWVESSFVTKGLSPTELALQLAHAKAKNVVEKMTRDVRPWVIVSADTVVEVANEILGKPHDRNDALRMLRLLNGKHQFVHTGVCLISHAGIELKRVGSTKLKMDLLLEDQIEEYLATDQWRGKAGAFGYQDGWDWLHVIEGEESNIVGLPMKMFAEMLCDLFNFQRH
ncbi:MAG TPA: nucleoside triphosphate pyrophosphatase [Pirellulaceae bacterium]|nr:nucleoside triphosphate pyrophosphatase [Pirellulaceae bacterium]